MPTIALNDIHLYYEEAGQGAPLLLLLGGTGALNFHSASWTTLVPTLSSHFHTFHIEQRGHGRTTNPSGQLSYELMADDIAMFIEALGLAPAHVAGMSDGAIIALVLGMNRPGLLRSLVCVGANYYLDEQLAREMAFFTPEEMEQVAPDWVATMIALHDVHHGPGYWRELVHQVRSNVFSLRYTAAQLQTIETPTLLIAGETDPYVSLEHMLQMRRSIPHSEMLLLNHAGRDPGENHDVQHTRPEVVGPVMVEFLARYTTDRER